MDGTPGLAPGRQAGAGQRPLLRLTSLAIAGLVLAAAAAAAGAPGTPSPSPSALDRAFGNNGESVVEANPACASHCMEFFGSRASALALPQGGGVVLAGKAVSAGPNAQDSWIARLDSSGRLDSAFGNNGQIEGAPGLEVMTLYNLPGGDVLALGLNEQGEVGLERTSSSGAPDSSFGPGGIRWLTVSGRATAALAEPSGAVTILSLASRNAIEVERLTAAGAPDQRFGRAGVARLAPIIGARPLAIARMRDGSLIVAGTSTARAGERDNSGRAFLARLDANGKLDRSFGSGGISYAPFALPEAPTLALGIAPNQHVLLATEESSKQHSVDVLALADFTPSGRLERSFADQGIARTVAPSVRGSVGEPTAITFDQAGDAIVVGEQRVTRVDTVRGSWFVARYTPSGRDCSFGSGGMLISSASGGARAVAVEGDGRIVIGGWSPPVREGQPQGAGQAFMAARYNGGGTPRTCQGEPANGASGHRTKRLARAPQSALRVSP